MDHQSVDRLGPDWRHAQDCLPRRRCHRTAEFLLLRPGRRLVQREQSHGHDAGTLSASSDVLVRTTDTEFLSPAEFSRSYWVTIPSGTIVLLSIRQGGSQVLGIEPGQLSPDVVPLSFPLDPLSSGFRTPLIPGLELPLPSSPLPPSPFPLPPAPTVNSDPFISAALLTGTRPRIRRRRPRPERSSSGMPKSAMCTSCRLFQGDRATSAPSPRA